MLKFATLDPDRVRELLASPCCHARLRESAGALHCAACSAVYPQPRVTPAPVFFDFIGEGAPGPGPAGVESLSSIDASAAERHTRLDWAARQEDMTNWYDDLIGNPDLAVDVLRNDYGCVRPLLDGIDGVVLDLGGGCGVTRHYLAPSAEYIVLDPGVEWLRPAWQAGLADRFPCQATPPAFVRGTAENMPFRSSAFDAVLALWSLNHVSDVAAVIAQTARVLKPGGRAVLVLEDMEPTWRDLYRRSLIPPNDVTHGQLARVRLKNLLLRRSWPTQADHVAIRESDLRRAFAPVLAVESRTWVRHYLTYTLRSLR